MKKEMEITKRIQLLLADMNRGVYEKETEISLSLLAALSGESILLLGPPGVAKSMVARRLKRAFVDAHRRRRISGRDMESRTGYTELATDCYQRKDIP